MNFEINNRKYYFPTKGKYTIICVCENLNIRLPRFCYHPSLPIAGNCRMCLVEVRGTAKAVVACSTVLLEGMSIYTHSTIIRRAREAVLEFLLINHPLDCPICDQGGECDLQDLSLGYGSDRGRFVETKRSVEDIVISPLVHTIMTRCIHCTRCVRYFETIVGQPLLGTMGRGRDTEVATYIQKINSSGIVGNVVDICPVGALTARTYAYIARPWELESIESIDVTDSLCSNIRIDVRGTSILRVLPKFNASINREWLSDRARCVYLSTVAQRLFLPMVRDSKTGILHTCSWQMAFHAIENLFSTIINSGNRIVCIGNIYMSLEVASLLRNFCISGGYSEMQLSLDTDIDLRDSYLIDFADFNSVLNVTLLFFIGTNPRQESPVLNIRIRLTRLSSVTYLIGTPGMYNYNLVQLGSSVGYMQNVLSGKAVVCRDIAANTNVLYQTSASVAQYNTVFNMHIYQIRNILRSNGILFRFVAPYTGDINCFELSVTARLRRRIGRVRAPVGLLYCVGNEPCIISSETSVLVYQGAHGTELSQKASVVLPSGLFTDCFARYLNCGGVMQNTQRVTPFLLWSDFSILLSLNLYLHRKFPLECHRILFSVRHKLFELNIRSALTRGVFLSKEEYGRLVQIKRKYGLDEALVGRYRTEYLQIYDISAGYVFWHQRELAFIRRYGGMLLRSDGNRLADAYHREYTDFMKSL